MTPSRDSDAAAPPDARPTLHWPIDLTHFTDARLAQHLVWVRSLGPEVENRAELLRNAKDALSFRASYRRAVAERPEAPDPDA